MTEVPVAHNLPTMFGLVPEKNVTFCIDTSGSMYVGLDAVKEHLIETLSKRATFLPGTLFNLIEFNSEVTQWADKMVQCMPETVNVAKAWVKDLSPKTGTNTQDALLTALSDPNCDAVYLVTDGLPDQYPEDVLDHIGYAGQGRPIHCIYLITQQVNAATSEFLEDLASETYGSFHVVTLTNHGCVDKVTPIMAVDHSHRRVIKTVNGTMHPNSKSCSVSTTLQVDPEDTLNLARKVWLASNHYVHPYYHPNCFVYPGFPYHYYPVPWSRYRPAKGWLKAQEEMLDKFDNVKFSPSAGALLIGKKVLARSNTEGYFYLASVQSQILENKFLIAFGPTKHGKFKDTVYQETWVYDIISLEDAKRHAIIPGDKVLAPWEPDGERFCSGTVITGQEKRDAPGPDEDHKITVIFSNGKTETVPLDTAVWIPMPVFERLDLELKMPAEARKSLEAQTNYPQESLPGYPTSGPTAKPVTFKPAPALEFRYNPVIMNSGLYTYPDYIPLYPIFYKDRKDEVPSAVKSEDIDALIPGTNLTQKELQEKVSSQLEEELGKSDDTVSRCSEAQSESEGERKERQDGSVKREQEIGRLMEEITTREEEIRRLNDEAVRERQQQDKEADMDGIKKRRMLMDEIRKREKELELLKLEEEKDELEQKLERQRARRQEERREEILEREREWRSPGERTADYERLLRRNRRRENSLRKSVSFRDELEESADRGYDSGHGSSPELWESEENLGSLPPEYRAFYRRNQSAKARKPRQKPGWKYWGSDPAPEVGVKTTALSKPAKPFRQTVMQAPLEPKDRSVRNSQSDVRYQPAVYYQPTVTYQPVSRMTSDIKNHTDVNRQPDVRIQPDIRSQPVHTLEWKSPNFRYVDVFAKHNYDNSVGQLMKPSAQPQPPSHPRPVTFPNSEVGVALGVRERLTPAPEDLRREYRRARVIARETEFTCRVREEERTKELMTDQHRQKILGQIQFEKGRQLQQYEAIQRTFEAKQRINQELQVKLTENSHCANEREQRRLAAKVAKREQREQVWAERAQEVQEKVQRQQEAKVQRSQARWDEVHNRLEEADRVASVQEQRSRAAKLNRIQHFRNLEEISQKNKDLRIAVANQSTALFNSGVLP